MRPLKELKTDFASELWDIEEQNGVYRGITVLGNCGTCSVIFVHNLHGIDHVEADLVHPDRSPSFLDIEKLKNLFYGTEEAYLVLPKELPEGGIIHSFHLWRPVDGLVFDKKREAQEPETPSGPPDFRV